jgi:tetratricopeptide (TPR) repeat protein
MNPSVLLRFIKLMAIATFVMVTFWVGWHYLAPDENGDFEVRQGDILLGDQDYDAALERFTAALDISPNHRGALMGRAVAYLQSGRHEEAEAEFTYLIGFLTKNLETDDITGRAVMAAAYANRGILHDRLGRYEKALSDYIQALKIDEETVSGPGVIDDILLYRVEPATVRGRAVYIKKQLALPEDQRLLRVPELDSEQRMYKP